MRVFLPPELAGLALCCHCGGGGLYALQRYAAYMDIYEKAFCWRHPQPGVAGLVLAAPALIDAGRGGSPLLAIGPTRSMASAAWGAETVFGLKYFLSSQSAILWMSMLFFMATLFYWIGMFSRGEGDVMSLIGSRLVWVAVGMALIGTMVRWYESYLFGADIGHIPVSNLYEVFVMFCWMTALFYLYYEEHYDTRALGFLSCWWSVRPWAFAVVHGGARRARNPALGAGTQKLVDEAARTRQFHWIRYVCTLGHGRFCLPDQAAGDRNPLVQAGAAVAAGRGAVL